MFLFFFSFNFSACFCNFVQFPSSCISILPQPCFWDNDICFLWGIDAELLPFPPRSHCRARKQNGNQSLSVKQNPNVLFLSSELCQAAAAIVAAVQVVLLGLADMHSMIVRSPISRALVTSNNQQQSMYFCLSGPRTLTDHILLSQMSVKCYQWTL